MLKQKLKKLPWPNLITSLRLLLTITIVLLIYPFGKDLTIVNNQDPFAYHLTLRWLAATIVFVIASTTDFFDGWIARKLNLVSNFGKLFDELVDKILTNVILITLTAVGVVPIWLTCLLIARDFYMGGLRQIIASKQIILAANWGGKITTILKMLAVTILLICGRYQTGGSITTVTTQVSLIPLYLTLIMAFCSALIYTYQSKALFKT